MQRVRLSNTKDYFIKDTKSFFYLADTVWSAFTRTSMEEWEEYLEYRKMQGFNVLQINILPQWDSSGDDPYEYPFMLTADGRMDFYKINKQYFERAAAMLEKAVAKGFVPALVVLWLNYVPDTWFVRKFGDKDVMPLDAVKPYTAYLVSIFERFNPIYLLSGDSDIDEQTTIAHYMCALRTIKELSPHAVTTLHLCAGNTNPPECFVDNNGIDFYMYQSGHNGSKQQNAYLLASQFYEKEVKRPIVNGEPCYEGIGYEKAAGRYNDFHVRRAAWQSLLSGAKAGVTYGAHGIWNWHKKNLRYHVSENFGMPFEWKEALRFRGAWDMSYAKWIFETYDLFDLEPHSQSIMNNDEVRMAISRDKQKAAIYTPCSNEIIADMDLTVFDWEMINLSTRYRAIPEVEYTGSVTVIKPYPFSSDALFIGRRK